MRAISRAVSLATVCLAAACSPTPSPWDHFDTAQVRAEAAADPGRICRVRFENGTQDPVSVRYRTPKASMNIGTIPSDASLEAGIPCADEIVWAWAVSENVRQGQGRLSYRKRESLDPVEITRIRFTIADRAR